MDQNLFILKSQKIRNLKFIKFQIIYYIKNRFDVERIRKSPQSFLNKCLAFSLNQIDENININFLVLAGIFIKDNLYKKLEED